MKNYQIIFNTLPFPCLVFELVGKEFFVKDSNKKFFEVTGKVKEDLIGLTLSEAFPENPGNFGFSSKILQESLKRAYTSKETVSLENFRYDLRVPKSGEFEERYWMIENVPVEEETSGEICYLLNVVKDITAAVLEKKKTVDLQAQLLEKKEKHQHFIEKNSDGLFSFDLEGNFITVNEGLSELAETSQEELLKMNFLPICAPYEQIRVQGFFQKAVQGENQKFEADFISGRGRKIILEVSLVPIKFQGEITGVYGIAKDITLLRNSKNALEQSEKKFKALVQEGSDVITILNIDGTYKFVSETSTSILDLKPHQLLNENAFNFIHPDDKERVRQLFLAINTCKHIRIDSYRFKNGAGEWRWLESKATNLCSEPGVEGIVVNSRDITERINFQKALVESEEKYRSFFENTLDAILVTIPTGEILAANPAACKMFQRSEKEICGIGRQGIIDKEDPRLPAALDVREKTGKANVELYFVRKDGSKFTGEVTSSIFKDKEGNVRTSTIIRDITEKKQLEARLQRSREKYKFLFTYNPLPNWIYDNKTLEIIDVNEAAIRHYGYSYSEFLQLNIKDLQEEEENFNFKEFLKQSQNNDPARFDKFLHRKKDGSTIKVEVNSYKFNFDKQDCTLVVSRDITNKEAILQKLRDREAKLRTAQKIARLGYWEHNFKKDTLYWTGEVYRIWGRDRKNYRPSTEKFLETIHPEDIKLFKQEMEASLSGLQEMNVEHRILLPGGGIKWVLERGKLILDDTGVAIRFEGTVQDITEAKQRMQDLMISEARHSQILNSQTNYLTRLNLNCSFTYVNRKYWEDFGWIFPGNQIIGQEANTSVKDYHWPKVKELAKKCINSPNTVYTAEFDKIQQTGGVKHTLWDFVCLTDADDQPLELQGVGIDITDRVKAERALKESNSRYELVTRATIDAIWDWKVSTGTLYWGEGFKTLFGYDCNSLSPTLNTWEDNIHPEDAEEVLKDIHKALESDEENWQAEYRFKKADGSYAHVIDKGFIIRDENNSAVRMAGAMQDITEKKQLEDLLEKATSLSRIGSYEVDFQNESVYWSPMTKKIHEVGEAFVPPSSKNHSFYERFYKSHLIIAYKEAVKGGMPVDVEVKITTAKGNRRWVRILGEPTFEDGKCIKVSGSFQDIDQIKRAEIEALQASEEKSVILESIGDAFLALDHNWAVTYYNKKAEEVLHYPKEDILGKNLMEVIPIKNTPFEFYYHKAARENEIQHFEAFYDDHQAWYEVNVYPSPNGLSIYFTDITERKNADIKLRELNKNLEKYTEELVTANKGLEQFSYIISHNLRSPVANIIGLANLLEEEHYSEEVKAGLRRELYDSSQRLDSVIKDLNQILQVKNNFSDIKEPINLNELVFTIKSTLRDQINREQVEINSNFGMVDTLTTVSSYLHSIFYNLIFNSIKFRRVGVPPVIAIRSESVGDSVRLIFSDNGLGIDMAKKENQLFKLYKRFHHHVEGKGMGLFMVKTQVEMLGGKIAVFSEVNKGTTFILEFKASMVENLKSDESAAVYSS